MKTASNYVDKKRMYRVNIYRVYVQCYDKYYTTCMYMYSIVVFMCDDNCAILY